MTAGYQYFKEYTASTFLAFYLEVSAKTFFQTAVPYAQKYAL